MLPWPVPVPVWVNREGLTDAAGSVKVTVAVPLQASWIVTGLRVTDSGDTKLICVALLNRIATITRLPAPARAVRNPLVRGRSKSHSG
jgi:hypothetical protein